MSNTPFLLLPFAVVFAHVSCVASPQERISSYEEALWKQGYCYYESYDRELCEQITNQLEKALAEDPNLVDAHITLSIAYWTRALEERSLSAEEREALKEQSTDMLRTAVNIDSGNVKANEKLIWRTKDRKERLVLARKFVAAAPDRAESHETLAEVLLQQGRLEEAVAAQKRSMELRTVIDHHEIGGHWYTARDLAKEGHLKEAVELYEAIFAMYERLGSNRPCPVFQYVKPEQFQDFPDFRAKLEELYPYCKQTEHVNRAMRLEQEGKIEEAIAELELELQESPYYTRTYISLARLYAQQGETERAREAVQKLEETEKDPYVRCSEYEIMERLRFQDFAPEPMAKLQKECEQRKQTTPLRKGEIIGRDG